MPRLKKPHIATLGEVNISRNGDYAEITYRDKTVGGVNLKIGPEVGRMTDQESSARLATLPAGEMDSSYDSPGCFQS